MSESLDDGRNWGEWLHGHNALQGVIETLQSQSSQLDADSQIARKATFDFLLTQLQQFAEDQFDFLYQGLDPHGKIGPFLEPSLRYPRDFVMRSTLDQIGFDLVVLQSALYQRALAQEDSNGRMGRTLAIADRLACYALQPAVRHGLLQFDAEKVTALTYFQKAPHIRMIPYAPVALIGLPFSALAEYQGDTAGEVGNAVDLLAIPHEIGHYVYQHGSKENRRLQNALYQTLQGQPDWLSNWAEEIFADVYGCLVAGPVMVRDFLDLTRAGDIASLLQDDNEHPTPVLRPLLYADTLKLFADKANGPVDQKKALNAIAEQASDRWNRFRGKRGEEHINERRAIIEEAIKETLERLIPPDLLSTERLWSLPDMELTAAEQYDRLYEKFYDEVAGGTLFSRLSGPDSPPDPDGSWDTQTPLDKLPTLRWLKQTRKSAAEARDRARRTANAEGKAKEERDELVKGVAQEERAQAAEGSDQQERIPTEVWTLVVSMNGWATNGPEQQPDPKVT